MNDEILSINGYSLNNLSLKQVTQILTQRSDEVTMVIRQQSFRLGTATLTESTVDYLNPKPETVESDDPKTPTAKEKFRKNSHPMQKNPHAFNSKLARLSMVNYSSEKGFDGDELKADKSAGDAGAP